MENPDVQAALDRAVALHRQGRFQDAAAAYAQILARVPRSFEVLHMLGVVRFQTGDLPEAHRLVRNCCVGSFILLIESCTDLI